MGEVHSKNDPTYFSQTAVPLPENLKESFTSRMENDYPGITGFAAREFMLSEPIDGTGIRVASFLVEGGEYGEGSYAGAVITPEGTISSTMLAQATWNSDRSDLHIDMFSDGEKTQAKDFKVDDLMVPQSNKLLTCLQAAGVTTYAAISIIATCGGLCAVTVGAGCVACAVGFSAMGGTAVGMCFGA
ncbi:hypothetical protein [Corynebacterium rouxii]|nr:hypothetical protein [Corynebacterium rouxii]